MSRDDIPAVEEVTKPPGEGVAGALRILIAYGVRLERIP